MPPEPIVRVSWSILKAPVVIEHLGAVSVSFREEMTNVMDSLQSNPQPPEALAEKVGDSITFRIAVDTVDPPSYLCYSLEEAKERIIVTGIMRKKFS